MSLPQGLDGIIEATAKLVLAAGSVATGAYGFVKWAIPWAEKMRGTSHGLDQLQVLHDTMKSAIKMGAHRVIVFYGHNSGGIPTPGSPFYATAVHWEKVSEYDKQYGRPEESIKDYSAMPVDGAYIAMLNELKARGTYRFKMSVEQDCLMKRVYHKAGVSDSLFVYIGIFKRKIYYMSFAVYEGEFTDDEIMALSLKGNIIRGIITKAQK